MALGPRAKEVGLAAAACAAAQALPNGFHPLVAPIHGPGVGAFVAAAPLQASTRAAVAAAAAAAARRAARRSRRRRDERLVALASQGETPASPPPAAADAAAAAAAGAAGAEKPKPEAVMPQPPPTTQPPLRTDPAKVALVVQRLTTAEWSLRKWGYLSEVVYTWLGLISLGVAVFRACVGSDLSRTRSLALGLASVGLSLVCALVGWYQARVCRRLGRRCGLAASSLEPGGPTPPAAHLLAALPALVDIESGLRARQRTAWLGAFFAVVGMEALAGLLVAKLLMVSGPFVAAPGLDVFTLLSVCNAALSHVISGGAAALQQSALPPAPQSHDDQFRGWAS